MKKTAQSTININKTHSLGKSAINAMRLLERLKSPFLHIASQIPLTQNPHSHNFPKKRKYAAEVEALSRGRFTLAKDLKLNGSGWNRDTRLKIYDRVCGHCSWVSMAKMKANKGRLEQWCCYCGEPTSFEHIGNELTAIQRFVEIRSGGKAFFNFRNTVENTSIHNECIFNCIICKGLPYDIPFSWFLRDSKPGLSSETNGCPCCNQKK